MPMLADLVLVVHFLFVLFVVGGLALIWLGTASAWQWVSNYWFRIAHLAAICFVATEALIGMACPLTEWEDSLRGAHAGMGFVARWVHRLLFYDFPGWMFATAYVMFALAVVLTWWLLPPRQRNN